MRNRTRRQRSLRGSLTSALLLASAALGAGGCAPSVDEVCAHFGAQNAKPPETGEKSRLECNARMTRLKTASPAVYSCESTCIMEAKGEKAVNDCARKCSN